MTECKQGGEHDPVEISGYWYCAKCNKPVETPKGPKGEKKK